jgi:hypothetical protein
MLLLDLDRTLFDTSAFLDAIIETVLPSMCDYDVDYIRAQFESQRAGSGTLLYELDYSVIFSALEVTAEQFTQNTLAMLTPDQFVYDDAKKLFDWLTTQNMVPNTKVLSFGSKEIQELKFALSPYLKSVPLLTTLSYKREYIATNFRGETGYLIDDKFGQQLPNGWVEIHLARDASKNLVTKLEDSVWRIQSLTGAEQILQTP